MTHAGINWFDGEVMRLLGDLTNDEVQKLQGYVAGDVDKLGAPTILSEERNSEPFPPSAAKYHGTSVCLEVSCVLQAGCADPSLC